MTEMREIKINSEEIYNGKILRLDRDLVKCPNGNEAYREVVRHHGGAAILCLNEENEVLLERQFRYAYDEVIYEIPAGKLEKGEDPYCAALRELEEETGFMANKLESLGVIYPSCGYTDEKIYLFLANDYTKTKTHFDDDEVIETIWVSIKKLKNMILNGEIKDAKTICALNNYLIKDNK